MEETQRLHAFVEGRVQGVGFRYFVLEHAKTNNLTGWVRNRIDDRVEVLAEGTRERLEILLDMLRIGPSRSMVSNVTLDWSESQKTFTHFSIMPTED
jgi:acylphosphatase